MYKILVHGLTPNLGGLESFILNYYRNMDHNKIHFDFICNDPVIACGNELKSYGCKIIHLPMKSQNPIRYKRNLNDFFKKYSKDYDCLWDNALTLSNLDYLRLAKKYGIKKRIIHAHNSQNMFRGIKGKIKGLLHVIHKYEIEKYATDFFAASIEARDYFYLPKLYGKVRIIKNAIDAKQFKFNSIVRRAMRSKLGLNDYFILGNVARLQYQKNQIFLLYVLKYLKEKNKKIKLILVGDGPDHEMLIQKAREIGVLDDILFVGMQKNISEWLDCFDVFIFPSLFEGLGIALLEAEANGLPVIASKDVIPAEVRINSNFKFISLNLSPKVWANQIQSMRNNNRISYNEVERNFKQNGWDIQSDAIKLENILIKNKK